MKPSRIYLVIGLMVFAMIGLAAVQFAYIQNTITLKEAQFRYNVKSALAEASAQVERYDAVQRMQRHRRGRAALEQLDSIQRVVTNGWTANGGFYHRDTILITEEGEVQMSYMTTTYPEDQGPERLMTTPQGTPTSQVVMDMLAGVMDVGYLEPYQQRLHPFVIDSMVTQALENYGINADHRSAIFDGMGRAVVFDREESLEHLRSVAESAYSVRLFPNDWFQDSHYLNVYFPSQRSYVLTSLWPMLLTSSGLMLLIIGAFAFTIVTIFRQKRVSEIKNDFINNMTHELKTPISTISLACEALSDPDMRATTSSTDRFVGMIREENQRLGTLVENVLRSAVLDRGELKLRIEPVDVHEVVQSTVTNMQLQFDNRSAELTLDLQSAQPIVPADSVHLTNVVFNLLDNALKYSPDRPRITICSRSDADGVSLSVMDNGIGISKADQDKVFDSLYRVPTGNTHDVKGFGLGLSYVRAVVEKHGGDVKLKSSPGRGSTFTITIPYTHEQD